MLLSAKHILVTHEYEAKDIIKKIKEGKVFEDLARDFSICASSKSGGDLGEFSKGKMIPSFENALVKLSPGEISEIVKTKFGHHIIKRIK